MAGKGKKLKAGTKAMKGQAIKKRISVHVKTTPFSSCGEVNIEHCTAPIDILQWSVNEIER